MAAEPVEEEYVPQNEEEWCEELLYAAADGKLARVQLIVEAKTTMEEKKSRVNWADGGGKTPLHACSANGHLEVVNYLIANGATHTPNSSGSTPVHWAVLNKKLDVTKALLAAFPSIDVMIVPNKWTQSVMTLAFQGNEAPVLQAVLEHKSAAQLDRDADEAERKMKARQEKDAALEAIAVPSLADAPTVTPASSPAVPVAAVATAAAAAPSKAAKKAAKKAAAAAVAAPSTATSSPAAVSVVTSPAGPPSESKSAAAATPAEDDDTVTHEFSFVNNRAPPTLKIREMPINDNPFGTKPSEDSTGHGIWPAAIICARWIADMREFFKGKTVLELGAGCGLPGLTALVCTEAAKVVFTDIHVPALHNIQHNIDLNLSADQRARASIRTMDWYDSKTWGEEKFDIVIGTDLVYSKTIVTPLMNVMKWLVKPGGVVQYVVRAHSDRDGLTEFIQVTSDSKTGFAHYNRTIAPEHWKDNPLTSGSQDGVDLYFYELQSSDVEYALHTYAHTAAGIPRTGTVTAGAVAAGTAATAANVAKKKAKK